MAAAADRTKPLTEEEIDGQARLLARARARMRTRASQAGDFQEEYKKAKKEITAREQQRADIEAGVIRPTATPLGSAVDRAAALGAAHQVAVQESEGDPEKRWEILAAHGVGDAELAALPGSPFEKRPPQRVSTQNFLLRNLDVLSKAHQGITYKDVTRVKTNEPATILNRYAKKPNMAPFLNIKPHQVAALVPKIKLFLVYQGEDSDKKDMKIPLKFEDSTDPNAISNITNTRFGRGDGVGIKSFSVQTQGTNPAEGALVKCTLQIFFQNIEMLASQTPGDVPGPNDYIELILRRTRDPKKTKDSKGKTVPYSRIVNRYGFRLMAVIGWAVPQGSLGDNDVALKDALRESKQTIYLNLVDHTIDFKQDGTAELTCDYQGALEQILSNSNLYDVLHVPDDGSSSVLTKLQGRLDELVKKGENIKDESGKGKELEALNKQIEELKKQRNSINKKIRARKYAEIMNRLYVPRPPNPSRIGTIDLTPAEMKRVKEGKRWSGASVTITKDKVKIASTDADVREAHAKAGAATGATAGSRADTSESGLVGWFKDLTSAKKQEDTRLSFIYFGDLVDIMTETMVKRQEEDKSSPNAHILLGPVSYNTQLPNGTITRNVVNLADVPIAMKAFEFWFNKNVTKQKLDNWSLRSFLKSAVSELVLNALGEHSKPDEGLRRNNIVGIHSFLARKKDGKEPIPRGTKIYDLDSKEKRLVLADAERDDMENMKPYILVYGSIEVPESRDPSKVAQDIADGIYHFNIGSDRGLLKSVNFKKTDVQFLREARLTSQDAEEGQLRDKYDATLELIGSSFLFTPGQKIYINPTLAGFGSVKSRKSIARMLGLGGYYDVIQVDSSFDRARGYVTTLTCNWSNFGVVKDEESSEKTSTGTKVAATVPAPEKETPSLAAPPDGPSMGSPSALAASSGEHETPAVPVERNVAQKMAEEDKAEQAKVAKEEAIVESVATPPAPDVPPSPSPPTRRQATEAERNTFRQRLERDVANARESLEKATGRTMNLRRTVLRSREQALKSFDRNPEDLQAVTEKGGSVRFIF